MKVCIGRDYREYGEMVGVYKSAARREALVGHARACFNEAALEVGFPWDAEPEIVTAPIPGYSAWRLGWYYKLEG